MYTHVVLSAGPGTRHGVVGVVFLLSKKLADHASENTASPLHLCRIGRRERSRSVAAVRKWIVLAVLTRELRRREVREGVSLRALRSLRARVRGRRVPSEGRVGVILGRGRCRTGPFWEGLVKSGRPLHHGIGRERWQRVGVALREGTVGFVHHGNRNADTKLAAFDGLALPAQSPLRPPLTGLGEVFVQFGDHGVSVALSQETAPVVVGKYSIRWKTACSRSSVKFYSGSRFFHILARGRESVS